MSTDGPKGPDSKYSSSPGLPSAGRAPSSPGVPVLPSAGRASSNPGRGPPLAGRMTPPPGKFTSSPGRQTPAQGLPAASIAAPPPLLPLLTAPNGEPLPLAYRWLRANGVYRLLPWTFIDRADEAQRLRGEFVREVAPPNQTPVRDLFPFALRKDREEIAGFIVTDGMVGEEVALVALTWKGRAEKAGWPAVQRFHDLWAFVRDAMLEDSREWANEEGLGRLLAGKPR
jgi:hypothetical protein